MIKQAALMLYGWLLWLYPPDFRSEFGDEMKSVFAERLAERVSTFAILLAMLREMVDLLPSVATAYMLQHRIAGGFRGRIGRLHGSIQPTAWRYVFLSVLAGLTVLTLALRLFYGSSWEIDPAYIEEHGIPMIPADEMPSSDPFADIPMVREFPVEFEALTWALAVTGAITALVTLFTLIKRRRIESWSFIAIGSLACCAAGVVLGLIGALVSRIIPSTVNPIIGSAAVLTILLVPGPISLILIQRSKPLPARAWGILAIIPLAVCFAIPQLVMDDGSMGEIDNLYLRIGFGYLLNMVIPSIFIALTAFSLWIAKKHGPAAALLVLPLLSIMFSEVTRSTLPWDSRQVGITPYVVIAVVTMSLIVPSVLALRATSREAQIAGILLPILLMLALIMPIPNGQRVLPSIGIRLIGDYELDWLLRRLSQIVPSVVAVTTLVMFYDPTPKRAPAPDEPILALTADSI